MDSKYMKESKDNETKKHYIFLKLTFQVTIREDAPKFSKLVTVKAIDPENAGPVSFAISGGDDEELFQVSLSVH